MNGKGNIKFAEVLILLTIFAVTNLLSYSFQERIQLNNGQGFDGRYYYEVAEQSADNSMLESHAPFVYRFGTPMTVALLSPGDLDAGFFWFNLAGNTFIVILLCIFLSLFINSMWMRVLLVSLYITMWHAPSRLLHYYPVHVDHWAIVFLLLGLILVHLVHKYKQDSQIYLLAVLVFVGVFFREIVFAIAIILLFVDNPVKFETKPKFSFTGIKIPNFKFFIPLIAGITGLLIIQAISTQTNDYSFFYNAAKWAFRKPLPVYMAAWCVAYGPVLFIMLYNWRVSLKFLGERQHLLMYFLMIMVLAQIGGTDTLRFAFWGMPVVYLLIGMAIEAEWPLYKSVSLIAFFVLLQVLAQRLFWVIPQFPSDYGQVFPFITYWSNEFHTWDLWPTHGDKFVNAVLFAQYILVGAIIIIWLNARERKLNLSNGK